MAIPSRNAKPGEILADSRTFFVTSKTESARRLLQSERMAMLFIDVLKNYTKAGKFIVHDFVVMPNHVHVLVTIGPEMTIEKAVQLMKGHFSFRAKRELGVQYEIWQRGFSDERIRDRASFLAHRKYIGENPVKASLARTQEEFRYSSFYFRAQKAAAAKASQENTGHWHD